MIVFRTLGGGGIGLGHFFRCISLGKAIVKLNNKVKLHFIINRQLENSIQGLCFDYTISSDFDEDVTLFQELEPDLIVFDSYLADDKYLLRLSKIAILAIFDDNNDIYCSSIPDVIINGNIYASDLEYKKRDDGVYLLGTDYLAMKEEYWNLKDEKKAINPKQEISKDSNILITTGGSDEFKISLKMLEVLLNTTLKKTVVVGSGYCKELIHQLVSMEEGYQGIRLIHNPNSLKNHILAADIVITAGGSTIYEVLSQRRLPLIFSLADNQDLACSKFQEAGLKFLGKYPNIKFDLVLSEIEKLQSNSNGAGNVNNRLDLDIDGRGALRIAVSLLEIINSQKRGTKNG